jgi:Protein of unknown function (DUF2829)
MPRRHSPSPISCDFGWAIRQLREGLATYRVGWNNPGEVIYLREGFIFKVGSTGTIVVWEPTFCDLLAEDWVSCTVPPVTD